MGNKNLATGVIVAVIVVIVAVVGYVLWSKSAPPEPTIPEGQSIQNPFGNRPPGGGATRGYQGPGNPKGPRGGMPGAAPGGM